VRDCSTYQFRYVADDLQVTTLSELEFHNKFIVPDEEQQLLINF